jgi:N-acetyl-alpha-D-glucosaminyl L-malate synthase BshA
MRIGMLCHRGVGGSVRVAFELAKALGGRGHTTYLFARSPPFDHADGDGGVHLRTLTADSGLTSQLDADWSSADVDALADLVASVELDLLHYHYAVPFAAVAQAVRARLGDSAPPVVGTLHGTDVSRFGRDPARVGQIAELLGRADALTTVSQSFARLAVDLFGLPQAPTVVPNFVDLARFTPGVRGRSGPPRVAHVSNLRPVKQPEVMARIYAGARRRVAADLWLVGAGEGSAAVDAIVSEAGVADSVVRFGLRTDLEAILPHTDVLLMTSRSESFCLAALEAAACGVPTVAPRVGGLPELVRDGVSGLLFEPGDEDRAVGALMTLLQDDLLRARMSRAARAVATEFQTSVVVPRYEALYLELLGRAGLPRDDRPALRRMPSCAS